MNNEELNLIKQGHKLQCCRSLEIIFKVIFDLKDRSGLGNEFEQIDDSIQEEIIDSWISFFED